MSSVLHVTKIQPIHNYYTGDLKITLTKWCFVCPKQDVKKTISKVYWTKCRYNSSYLCARKKVRIYNRSVLCA